MDKRALGFSLALGALLAVSMWLMVDLILFREMPDLAASGSRYLVLVGASSAAFALGALGGYFIMRNAPRWVAAQADRNPLKQLALTWDVRSAAIAAAVLIVFWLPYIIAQFPAGMNFDTYVQIYQYLDPAPTYYDTLDVYWDVEYVDHHPVFDTLVYGTFFWIGYMLGVQNLGLFLAALFQTALTAAALGASCCYLARIGVPKLFRLISLVFCALVPYIPLWSMTLMKDALQAPLFVAFLLCYFEAFRTRGECLRSRGWLACLIVFSCLVILTKKTGAAAVVPALLVLAAYCALARKRAIVAAVAVPVICFAVIPLALYPAIGGVHAGGTQEGLGFAMKQVMTVIVENDDLSDEERAAVAGVLDIESARGGYHPSNVDQVKNKAKPEATRADYLAFLKAYMTIGLRHPLEYTISSLNIAAPYYCVGAPMTFYGPGDVSKNFLKCYGQELESDGIQLNSHQPAFLIGYHRLVNDLLDIVRNSPFGRIFLSRGLYGGWVPIICLILCLYRDKRYAIAFVPVVLYMAVLLICPVVSSRYMLGLLDVAPLMLGIACSALGGARAAAAGEGEDAPLGVSRDVGA